ncbi:MAG TPA: hypothetical protein ENI88_05075 [Desulfobulbus sp.]|nr:hypothetical protein [Desulfobulbus sp.]
MTKQQNQQQVKVRYNETSALFASQFILNTSAEDITINFSSGPLSDPANGETILPVHTRMAMTREGARRLHAVLGNILAQQENSEKIPPDAQAKLPDIKQ